MANGLIEAGGELKFVASIKKDHIEEGRLS